MKKQLKAIYYTIIGLSGSVFLLINQVLIMVINVQKTEIDKIK